MEREKEKIKELNMLVVLKQKVVRDFTTVVYMLAIGCKKISVMMQLMPYWY